MVKKLFVFLVLLIPATVMAGFQVVEDAPTKPTPPTSTAAVPLAASAVPSPTSTGSLQLVALTYIGEPDTDIPVISGFGRDLKLSDALKQIVPIGWHAFLKEDMAARGGVAGVNWKGGRRWVEVLDILANEQNIAIEVDWPKKQLYVGEMKKASTSSTVAESPPKPVILSVKSGSLLRDTLNEWAHQSGWSLVWGISEQDDYRLEAGNIYPGDFKEAVHGLINSLPPTVRIHAELRPDNAPPLLYITIEEGAR